jgi:hypothetical protein
VLADLFHRTVCITGFVPVSPPLGSFTSTSTPQSVAVQVDECDSPHSHRSGEQEEGGEGEDTEQDSESDARPTCEGFPTAAQQHADARMLARRRVYDMRYLRGDRLWGPYQSVTRAAVAARPSAGGAGRTDMEGQGERVTARRGPVSGRAGDVPHLGTLAWAMGVDVNPDEVNSSSDNNEDEDDGDGEWREPADAGRPSASSAVPGYESPADDDDGVEMEPLEVEQHPLIAHMLGPRDHTTDDSNESSRRRTRRSNPRMPAAVSPREIWPEHLRPDYTYLASVRIVVEANLRELFDRGASENNVEDTASEDRPGGVGLFWEDEDELMLARDGSHGSGTSWSAVVRSLSCPNG